MTNNNSFGTKYNRFIVSVASWESRFLLGSQKLLASLKPEVFLMSYCEEYAQLSLDNRTKIQKYCENNNIKFVDKALSFKDPVTSWKTIKKFLSSNGIENQEVTIDISTMPRETIWSSLSFLELFQHRFSRTL